MRHGSHGEVNFETFCEIRFSIAKAEITCDHAAAPVAAAADTFLVQAARSVQLPSTPAWSRMHCVVQTPKRFLVQGQPLYSWSCASTARAGRRGLL